jgi:hypothetical protein
MIDAVTHTFHQPELGFLELLANPVQNVEHEACVNEVTPVSLAALNTPP